MKISNYDKVRDQTAERVKLGLQCPECFSVKITLLPRWLHDPYRYQCEECGCEYQRA